MQCNANTWTSFSRSRNSLFSKQKNILLKCRTTHFITSPQRPSIHWLCTEVPTIKFPLLMPGFGQSNINRATSTLFTPKSARTLDGRPWIEKASINRSRAVAAKLLLLYWNYITIRLYSSIAPCITVPQRFNLWWLSICL